MQFKRIFLLFIALLAFQTSSYSQQPSPGFQPAKKNYTFRAVAEIGFSGVIDHRVQFGEDNTYFDYVEDGGQDVLFPTQRFSLELDFNRKNTLVFLYQPLELNTRVVLKDGISVNDLEFPAGINLNLKYGFPFYRLSYLREINLRSNKFNLALGLSLQIRNATIEFESSDGELRAVNRDVGPVPLLKLRGSYEQNKKMTLEVEIDGIYAPINYLNGSDSEVVGAFLDASIRQKPDLTKNIQTFLNLRYLGGGAEGKSEDNNEMGDGYSRNWLDFFTVSTGCIYEF